MERLSSPAPIAGHLKIKKVLVVVDVQGIRLEAMPEGRVCLSSYGGLEGPQVIVQQELDMPLHDFNHRQSVLATIGGHLFIRYVVDGVDVKGLQLEAAEQGRYLFQATAVPIGGGNALDSAPLTLDVEKEG